MAEISKPDYTYLWSSGGATVAPSNVKVQTGWTAEVPPFQWENWSQNRQDQAISHILQKGISVWSATGEYYFTASGERSYVQGSDGIIYVALQDSVGQNPVTATLYWEKAFSPYSFFPKRSFGIHDFLRVPDVPGGLIYQWSQATFTVGSGAITLPIPFPNAVLHTYVSSRSDAPVFATVNVQSSSVCFINLWTDTGVAPLVAQTVDILAIGY